AGGQLGGGLKRIQDSRIAVLTLARREPTRFDGGRLDLHTPRRSAPKETRVPAIATTNPATGETVKTFTAATEAQIEAAIARAAARFADYRRTDFAQRARWTHAAADLLEAEADDV